jgi:hypothetical protein
MMTMKNVAFLAVTPCKNESHLRVIKVQVLQQTEEVPQAFRQLSH